MSRLTPIDIQHAEFPRRSLGYDRREVRAFLERLALEVEAALKDAQGLRRRLAEAEAEVERLRGAEADLQQVVLAAERIATDVRENAKREAELLLEEAERARRARLEGVESAAVGARAELERLTLQRRLFKEQFRGLLAAYAAALDADDALAPTAPRRTGAAEPDDSAAQGALLDDSAAP